MKAIILAAGIGSRIGSVTPKCLSDLGDGQTILGYQIESLRSVGIREIYVVIGFKKGMIMEHYPCVSFIYNPIYHRTNTAKSLLSALNCISPSDVLWMNGDVFCPKEVLLRLIDSLDSTISYIKGQCGAEEVKCSISVQGNIMGISKSLGKHIGEAIGVNCVLKKDFLLFKSKLDECLNNDYFEKAIEYMIHDSIVVKGLDVSELECVEVDFSKDLDKARGLYSQLG